MGVIRRQSIGGFIYTYMGVILGFVNLVVISPLILDSEQIGLLQLLISISAILAQFSSLGFLNVTNKLFPYFKDSATRHSGFGIIVILAGILGFLIISVSYVFFKPYLIETNLEKSPLFIEYIHWLLPLSFFTVIFNLLDNYNKALYNAILGTFIKELVVRVGNLIILGLFFLEIIAFDVYVTLFIINLSLPGAFMFFFLLIKGEIGFSISKQIFTKKLKKEMLTISLFGLFSGFATIGVINIDKYMINQYIDLSATGIYSIAFYFGSLILLPNRPLAKISTTLVAESWKNNDTDMLKSIYYKTSINQLLIAQLLFLGLWCNIQNILAFLPPEYAEGKLVILFISLANLINMASGVSIQILGTSSRYRVHTYLIIFLAVMVIITNILFIPRFGIIGAALASLISTLVYVSMRTFYLYYAFKLFPFRADHLKALGVFLLILTINYLLPEFVNHYIDFFIRSLLITILYSSIVVWIGISEDGNQLLREVINKLRSQF